MIGILVAVVVEQPSDLAAAIAFAAPIRRAGGMVATPLAYAKPKRQMERARNQKPAYIAVLDGDRAVIIDPLSSMRYEDDAKVVSAALADLAGDEDPETDLGRRIVSDLWTWANDNAEPVLLSNAA